MEEESFANSQYCSSTAEPRGQRRLQTYTSCFVDGRAWRKLGLKHEAIDVDQLQRLLDASRVVCDIHGSESRRPSATVGAKLGSYT